MTVAIKVLGLSASPIKGGNCDKMVQESLKAAEQLGDVETEFVTMADKEVTYCKHCQYCIEHRARCRIKDDANTLIDMMERADGIIFGAPTWCRTLSPLLLNLFSRMRTTAFFDQALRSKVAGFLTVGFLGFGLENALDQMQTITYGHGIIPVARGYVIASAVVNGQRAAYLKDGIYGDARGMRWVHMVGERVVEVTRMIKYATEAGIVLPEPIHVSTGATMKRKDKVFVDGVWRPKK